MKVKIGLTNWIQIATFAVLIYTHVWSNAVRFARIEHSIETLTRRVDSLELFVKEHIARIDEMLNRHETRITVLEHDAKRP